MGADIHFELDGGPFSWWKLNLTRISADVHWLDESVALRDVRSDFYEGKMDGFAFFEFPRGRPGTDFNFTMNITNALLQGLMTDLFPGTNQPEGWLTGHLVVTKANSEGTHTANGYGNFSVRDGLLWNIPAFGVLSPVLNGISPGLGNSRATAGQCTFVMTNGVVRSDNLDIRTQPMRLQYRGTVDLDGRLNARVEAELLRDMFLIGPLVSTVFWPVTKLFEFKVTGMLGDPKMEPLNPVSKLLLMPFRPVRTIKGLFPENSNSRTNAPPENR
jgi:hypothetical protein